MEGTYSTLSEAYANCGDGEFVLTYEDGDKYIHAQSFKSIICDMMQQQIEPNSDLAVINDVNRFCKTLCDFVDAFPGAPVRLIKEEAIG